jgi:hypothetical protein
MKTYVLTVSEFFPKTHSKSGLPTGFLNSIASKTKKHTIRGNYELWLKRFDEIEKGNARLSLRYWTGKPYNSPQKEVRSFTKIDGIGIEKVEFDDYLYSCKINDLRIDFSSQGIAGNDGLSHSDFEEWFKKYDLSNEMAIIHFTNFRYCS